MAVTLIAVLTPKSLISCMLLVSFRESGNGLFASPIGGNSFHGSQSNAFATTASSAGIRPDFSSLAQKDADIVHHYMDLIDSGSCWNILFTCIASIHVLRCTRVSYFCVLGPCSKYVRKKVYVGSEMDFLEACQRFLSD